MPTDFSSCSDDPRPASGIQRIPDFRIESNLPGFNLHHQKIATFHCPLNKMNTYEESYQAALQMINAGSPCREVLSFLSSAAERAADSDSTSSIMLLDEFGLLRNGASPRLPADYLMAIDGLKPDPGVGTCAAAPATGSMVVTENFSDDTKWAELRHLPLALGFKGAWSVPIKSVDGTVLGTFGTYFTTKRAPTAREMQGIQLLARAAAIALERDRH